MGGIFSAPQPNTTTIKTSTEQGLQSVNTYQTKKKKKKSYQSQIFVIDLDSNR